MSKSVKSLPKIPSPKTVKIPVSDLELWGLFLSVIRSRTLGRVMSELTLQAGWAVRKHTRTDQIALARQLGDVLDRYQAAVRRQGGAA